jgi:hypothetical protein
MVKDLKKVNRVELINDNGRQFVSHDVVKTQLHYQDEGRTLKIFINENKKRNMNTL